MLIYAEPNRVGRMAQASVVDPLSARAGWREFVVGGQVAPPVTGASPLIAMVDTQLDMTHPEFAGSNVSTADTRPVRDFQGTANAAVAAAPANGIGIVGIWPASRVLGVALPDGRRITCADSARGIARAVRARAAVINMDYGAPAECMAQTEQILRAVKAGAVPVAAGGIEADQGSPPRFPADTAHVLTVGALGPGDEPAEFSSQSPALDLVAPGTRVLTAVPVSTDRNLDPDGSGDGFAFLSGTTVSGAMVAAAVGWVRAARPGLTAGQAAEVVRLGARDVGAAGRDPVTGFGVLSLGGALSEPAPADDPFEPNDDIPLVDGQLFGQAPAPLSRGRPASVLGTVDRSEDPADVHRMKIPAGAGVRVSLTPTVGDPDLYVMSGKARNVADQRALLGRSRRGEGRTEVVTVRNRGRRTATVYVVVRFSTVKRTKLPNATYALGVRPA